MTQIYNIYCDESAHLPKPHQPLMVLGALWCKLDDTRPIAAKIREIKERHGIHPDQEIKWTKVSPAKIDMYLELVDYFFATQRLGFRAVLIRNKERLDHELFNQDHDTWYYKMYYTLLQVIITPTDQFRIYLDIKDTRSAEKMRKLHQVLNNKMHDFKGKAIQRLQTVRSDEVEQIQLVDLLMGAVRYANLPDQHSVAKRQVVERIKEKFGYSITRSTLLREEKFNLFFWEPQEAPYHG